MQVHFRIYFLGFAMKVTGACVLSCDDARAMVKQLWKVGVSIFAREIFTTFKADFVRMQTDLLARLA